MIKKLILTVFIIMFAAAQNLSQSAFSKGVEDEILMVHDTPGIYVFKINTKKIGNKIKPFVASKLTTASDIYKNNDKFAFVINGGFFDILTGDAVSYVTIDGNVVETPFSNMKLIQNAGKTNRLEGILNRAEFRIFENERGNLSFDIDNHFAGVPEGKTIKHSIQGGPLVYPKMNLEAESFIVMENDKIKLQAADVLKRRERTVLALKNEILYFIIFTNQNKVNVNEIRDFCKKMKFDKAMALDGGASTSVNFKDLEIFSSFGSQRRVKSFLVVEK